MKKLLLLTLLIQSIAVFADCPAGTYKTTRP